MRYCSPLTYVFQSILIMTFSILDRAITNSAVRFWCLDSTWQTFLSSNFLSELSFNQTHITIGGSPQIIFPSNCHWNERYWHDLNAKWSAEKPSHPSHERQTLDNNLTSTNLYNSLKLLCYSILDSDHTQISTNSNGRTVKQSQNLSTISHVYTQFAPFSTLFFLFSVIYDPHGSSNETVESDRLSALSSFSRTRIHITEWILNLLTNHQRKKWVVYCQRGNFTHILEPFPVKMR
jgi:hypothetical protein